MSLLQETRTEPIEVINERLIIHYGKTIDGRARFRIVWSADQVEKRYGEFNEFYGNIYLRTVTGMREVKKYHYVNPPKYILEELEYFENPERPFEFSSYEPKWAFMTVDKEALWPIWDAVKIVVDCRLNPIKKVLSDYKAEDEAEKQKEIVEFEELLGVSSGDGVHELKNQTSGMLVKPVFMNRDYNG